ncbi:MAG: DoxX family protein [Planctomycetota bacterium]
MDKKKIAYWITTGLFCLAMAGSGVANLAGVEQLKESIVSLGYPTYLMTILGTAKLAGVVALLLPKLATLKEWAYAGFTFDLLGASASHAFAGHAAPEVAVPAVILSIAFASYLLRPSERRIVKAVPAGGQ